MSFTNGYAKAILDHIFNNVDLTSVPQVWVALSTTTPNEGGGNVSEPAGNAYARAETSPSDWAAATTADPSVVQNSGTILFPEATAAWGTITHVVIYDAATNGTAIAWAALSQPVYVDANNTPNFKAGDLSFSLD